MRATDFGHLLALTLSCFVEKCQHQSLVNYVTGKLTHTSHNALVKQLFFWVYHLSRVLYELESLSGETIKGKFYQEELTKVVNQDEYLIEKVFMKKIQTTFIFDWAPKPKYLFEHMN